MELEDIRSDLQSLRKLFGLLQSHKIGSQSTSSEYLDEKALIFLKNLLDGATERVFGAYSELMAAQLDVCYATPQSERLKGTPRPRMSRVPETSLGVAQSSASTLGCKSITAHEDARKTVKPKPQFIVSKDSSFDFSITKPVKRRRHCRISPKICIEQLGSSDRKKDVNEETQNPDIGDTSLYSEESNKSSPYQRSKGQVEGLELDKQGIRLMSSRGCPQRRIILNATPNFCEPRPLDESLSILADGVTKSGPYDVTENIEKKPDGAEHISKEIASSIEQIDLRILALRLAADDASSSEKSEHVDESVELEAKSIYGLGYVSPLMQQTKEGVTTCSKPTQAQEFVLGNDEVQSKQVSEGVWDCKSMNRVPQCDRLNLCSVGNEVLSQMVDENMLKPADIKLPGGIGSQTSKVHSPNDMLKLSEKVGKMMNSSSINNLKVQVGDPELKDRVKPSWIENQVSGQNVKAMVRKIELLSQLTSQSDQRSSHGCKYVQGMRVSASPGNMATATPALPAKMPSEIEKESQDLYSMPQKKLIRRVGMSRSSVLDISQGSVTMRNGKTQVANAGKQLSGIPGRIASRHEIGLPGRMYSRYMASPVFYRNGGDRGQCAVQGNKELAVNQKKILPCRLDIEGMSSSSVASSSWRSEQASTSGSDSEEYSVPDTGSQDYLGSTSYTYSGSYSLPSQTSGYKMSLTSSSDSEVDLSASRNQHHVGHGLVDTASMSVGSIKIHRSGNNPSKKKYAGRLRRLKDKLALIFHHHHHHHHHDEVLSDQKIKASHGRSLWKNAGKIFRGTGRTEKYGEQAAEKLTRSVIHKVPNKNQNGHFHALVKGLLKHVKNSRSSKPSKKGCIKRAGRNLHGSKKGATKLHWWQMLRQQRAVKMPTKPRVKLGFGTKKPRLRGLPKLMSDDDRG